MGDLEKWETCKSGETGKGGRRRRVGDGEDWADGEGWKTSKTGRRGREGDGVKTELLPDDRSPQTLDLPSLWLRRQPRKSYG